MTSQGNCIYLISDTISLPFMVKSCVTWDKWKNITCTKRILWWNHWTLTTECTFLLQHGIIGVSSLIDYLLGPQSCENKNLDVILSHNHCLPWILLQPWGKDIHIDKMKDMEISWRKLCFFCYQDANHEMLCKSQHCLSCVDKCE